MMRLYTFGKTERLSHRNQIDALFKEGFSFNTSPVKVVYRLTEAEQSPSLKILVTVPKKRFRKAVDRNHIKRLLREAYRLNRHVLGENLISSTICLHVGFIYIGDKADVTYAEIESAMVKCLERIGRMIGKHPNPLTP